MATRFHSPGPEGIERAERDRVQRVYALYGANPYYARIWLRNPAGRFIQERKWELIDHVLRQEGVEFHSTRLLDLGAGGGEDCARFRDLGFSPHGIVGLDLLEPHVRQAHRTHPWMALVEGNAARLPFPDGSFDLIFQSMMLSSVLDSALRSQMLREARRVLSPGGIFLSYDMRYSNPLNPNTRPVRLREIRDAFAGRQLKCWSTTGIPHLLRLLAPVSFSLCRVVEGVPFLRSHRLVLARKP